MKKRSIKRWGDDEEKRVQDVLGQLPSDFIVLNKVWLQDPEGRMSEIDHLVIGKTGVFCIETKGYRGMIYGSPDSPWKQLKSTRGGHLKWRQVTNPISQCQCHARTVRAIIESRGGVGNWVAPVVVFSYPQVVLNLTQLDKSEAEIISLDNLLEYIKTRVPDRPVTNIGEVFGWVYAAKLSNPTAAG